MSSYSYTSSYVSKTGTGSDSYSWTPNTSASITTSDLSWAKLDLNSKSTSTLPLCPFESCLFKNFPIVISRFEDTPEHQRLIDIFEVLSNKWVTPKEPICEVSFKKPVRASEFFKFTDIDSKPKKLILEDEGLTLLYYANLIGDFLDNYMVFKPYPSTKIKGLDSKYLRSVPLEYKGLNVLVYPMEGIYYICEYKDLERTKKMLQDEVEKYESHPEYYWGGTTPRIC